MNITNVCAMNKETHFSVDGCRYVIHVLRKRCADDDYKVLLCNETSIYGTPLGTFYVKGDLINKKGRITQDGIIHILLKYKVDKL